MSYFRRIIDRTLGPVPHSIRPAVTPASIYESSSSVAAKQSKPTIPVHKSTAPVSKESALDQHLTPVTEDAKTVKSSISPEGPQVLPAPAIKSSFDRSSDKASAGQSALIEIPNKESELPPVKNSGDAATWPELAPAEQPVAREVTMNVQESAEGTKEELPAANEEPPKPVLLDESQLLVGKANANDKLPLEETGPESLHAMAPPQGGVPAVDLKANLSYGRRQDASPALMPAAPGKTRYPAPANQSEETVVTINIGRIEVKAEMPAKSAPRHRFSPALSLSDYLKQRSEGKMG